MWVNKDRKYRQHGGTSTLGAALIVISPKGFLTLVA